MIIRVIIANFEVRRVLVDQGSLANILFVDAFNRLGLLKEQISPFHSTLVGFAGDQVQVKGHVELLTTFARAQSILVKYLVVERESSYNAILGRPSLNRIGAIVLTRHLVMKFPLLRWRSSEQIKKKLDSVMWIV